MKAEIGSFTPNTSPIVLALNDNTLQVKAVQFMVSKDGSNVNLGTGFADGVNNVATAISSNSSKNTDANVTHSILAYDNSTLKVAGYVSSMATAGQITVTLPTTDSTYKVYFLALGD